MSTITRKKIAYEALPTPGVDHCSTAETPFLLPHIDDKGLPKPPTSFRIGWRFTMACSLVATVFTFACNIIVMIWSSQQSRSINDNFLLFSGDCATVKTIDTWAHLAINILSTLLLGASNHTLQVLVAPTREDVDATHALHKSVDIAVPSITNWTFMTLQKRILFLIVVITSLPLHLIFNSVIFSTDSAIEYQATVVSSDFLQHNPTAAPWNDGMFQNTTFYDIPEDGDHIYLAKATVYQLWHDANSNLFTTIEPDHCRDITLNIFKSTYSNIILFTDFSSPNRSLISSYRLIPSQENSIPCALPKDAWSCMPSGIPDEEWLLPYQIFKDPYANNGAAQVTSCSIQQGQRHCTVELIPKLLAIVMVCNFLKGAALTYVLVSSIISEPLLTLGDAIASFLEISDKYTNHQGGLSTVDTRRSLVPDRHRGSAVDENMNGWWQPYRRYFSSVSPLRWMATLQLFFSYCSLGLGMILAFYGPYHASFSWKPKTRTNFSQQWQAGFGALFSDLFYQPQIFSDPTNVLIANAIIANTPQLVLSLAYITCNGLFTCMCVSAEWAGYAQEKKRGLRVTNPAGQQRRSYWLSLPFKISIPLLIMSGALHWLLSQTIYVVRLDFFTAEGTKSNDAINGIGWAPLMLVIFLAAAGVLLLVLLAFSLQKFPPGIPIVSGNSWAISAGCHAIKSGESLQKLGYGVISELGDDKYHVGFSSGNVRPLVPGEHYR
ncbi:MAG: hypothetical protein GOMPHAMPRED_002373 [Gomphillus americanus]|uniref:DUF6536 domain-containing protein n=1 Tax=Gomphillus americanus TaxID=1940652 RepID=A0A8H3FDP1_9LECA|nr:MAG: hypothetical protein GOMPHAMPRED_002373 [Gomphillus americanus]